MKAPNTNMRVLKRSRRKPESGDIFVYQLEQLPDRYYFGAVVSTDTNIGGFRDFHPILIYLYDAHSVAKTEVPQLDSSRLLVPPIGTNAQPFLKGVFEVVSSVQMSPERKLRQHCFFDPIRKIYLDEYGNILQGPIDPVGFDGLTGLEGIDREVSKALNIAPKRYVI